MIYPNFDLISTTEITNVSEYYSTPKDFFSNFGAEWDKVLSQVIKLETKQVYVEKGNPGYDLLIEGKFQEAVEVIPSFRQSDISDIYDKIKVKKVDFIRCRPVTLPLSDYLRWEFEVYKFNSAHGEKIYCVERNNLKYIFDELAMHDFMVFDYKKAFIHNYDESGEIQGGWVVNDPNLIEQLIKLYSVIRAHCIEFSNFGKTL